MEIETNQQADGVDVRTTQTFTREELMSQIASAQNDLAIVNARLEELNLIVAKLPVTPEE